MRLYSIMNPTRYQALESGHYAPPPIYDIDEHFPLPHVWLERRLRECVGAANDEARSYLELSWYRAQTLARPKPDLRSKHGLPGQPLYLVELEVPEREVLLVQWRKWLFVLMGCFVPSSQSEDEAFEHLLSVWGFDRDARHYHVPSYFAALIEASWERLFDIDTELDIWEPPHEQEILGVTWGIKPAWVVSARPFLSR